jgi:hypothetical protein
VVNLLVAYYLAVALLATVPPWLAVSRESLRRPRRD